MYNAIMLNLEHQILLEENDPTSVDCRRLIAAAGVELDKLYDEVSVCPLDPALLAGPRTSFLIARSAGIAIACGGIRPLSADICELKRMYVVPEWRRRGLAALLLTQIEVRARDLDYSAIWLETGNRQPAAIAMYEKYGYSHLECYGNYANDGRSVCFQKKLRLQ